MFAPLAVSCIARIREIFTEADADLSRLDVLILEIVRDLGLGILSAVLSAFGECEGGALRETGMNTVLGYVSFKCRYHAPAPGAPVSRQDRRKREQEASKGRRRKKNGTFSRVGEAACALPFKDGLGLVEGMTPALAMLHNRIAALAGSFREGAETLRDLVGVVLSESTFMRRAYAAGERAALEQELEVLRLIASGTLPVHLTQALTKVLPTLYVMLDGTGVPCVKRDTRGRKGKDGKPARTREIKVGVIGTFRWKDKRGRPVRDRGGETHIASAKEARDFGSLLRRVANSRGYGSGQFRIQICGDGAEWIAKIVKQAFPGEDVFFVNDFYHATEHLHAFLGCVLKKGAALSRAFRKARGILLRNGGSGLVAHLEKFYGQSATGNKDATRELGYFRKRTAHMKYPEYRKAGLYIGSGIIEAACRTDVARRCKQAGMHWRLRNAAAMCALVAKLRSGVPAAKSAA